jgi:3-oxoacyl-[acyl-carrier protein] reductase
VTDGGSTAPRTAIVTGAATGIGEGVARALASQGWNLVLDDLDADGLASLARELDASGCEVMTSTASVTSTEDLDGMVAEALDRFGRIDGLVVAAGGHFGARPTEELTDDEWESTIALNLTGAFKTARAVIPSMKEAGSGRIVMISSATGRMPTMAAQSVSSYAAAKAGVIGFVKQLAVEMGPHQITVNAVAPGTTWTQRVQKIRTRESLDSITATVPLGRIAEIDDQVGPILFLLSDASRYMTGCVLDVTGGRIMV